MERISNSSQSRGDLAAHRGSYHFQLDKFACFALSDGSMNYPLESLFANVPRAAVEDALRQRGLPTQHVTTPYTCLFVNTGRHRVMIDVGAGDLATHAGHMFPSIDNSASVTGTVLRNLQAAGFAPQDVDTVIITHAHPDHVGGMLDHAGQPIFANAQYFMARVEWEFWESDTATAKVPPVFTDIARHNVRPIQDHLTLIDDGVEVVPGICALAAYGHTPGHIALSITSGSQQLLHISDTVLYPLHLEHPDWVPAFDMLPAQAAASKQRILDQTAAERALVFAHHFPPFPNLGHVVKTYGGWEWQPVAYAP